MAILVDELREYPDVSLPFTTWCHMASDRDFDELHAFAERLGLRRRWFQRDHYDLPAHGRAAAVALGASEVHASELLERMAGPRGDRARRRGRRAGGVLWLAGADAPAVLRYPLGALVLIGGAGGERLARGHPTLALDAARPDPAAVAAGLRAGAGAVAVVDPGAARGLARAAGAPAHLLLLAAADGRRPRDPAPFASITITDAAAAQRLGRISFSATLGRA